MADGKKRGPSSSKKHKTLTHSINEMFINHYSIITSGIQEAMNKLQQQNSIVDFYFQFVGKSIPSECSVPLSTYSKTDSLTAQLCIITAHVMRFFGNSTLENQYIQEAHRRVSNILDCDTLDSAVALIMMSSYLGVHPKCSFYATIAYNIAKLPSINTTWMAYKVQLAAYNMSLCYNDNISHHQRCLDMLAQLEGLHKLDQSSLADIERVKLAQFRLSAMTLTVMKMDLEDIPQLLHSLSSPPITMEERGVMLEEVGRLHDAQRQFAAGVPAQIIAQFIIHFVNFLVYWRSGEPTEAFDAAIAAFEFYKANSNVLTLWNQKSLLELLLLPCYFELCNAKDLSKECLLFLNDSYAKTGSNSDLQKLCSELNLDLVMTYNIAQIEQELLCDFTDALPNTPDCESPFHP